MMKRTYRPRRRRVYRKRRIGRPLRGTTNSVMVTFQLDPTETIPTSLTAWTVYPGGTGVEPKTANTESSFAQYIPTLDQVPIENLTKWTTNYSYYKIIKLMVKYEPLFAKPNFDPQSFPEGSIMPDSWAFAETPLMWRTVRTPQEAAEHKGPPTGSTDSYEVDEYEQFRQDNGTHVKSGYRKGWAVTKLFMNTQGYTLTSTDVNFPSSTKWLPIHTRNVPHYGLQFQIDASRSIGYPFTDSALARTFVARRAQRWILTPLIVVLFRDYTSQAL